MSVKELFVVYLFPILHLLQEMPWGFFSHVKKSVDFHFGNIKIIFVVDFLGISLTLQDRRAHTLKIDPGISNELFLIVNISVLKICIDLGCVCGFFFVCDAAYLII